MLIAVFLFSLTLVSCIPGSRTQPAQGWSGTTLSDGILYMGSMEGEVVAVNSSTRNLEWSYTLPVLSSDGMSCGQTSVPSAIYGTLAVEESLVYVGSYNGEVLALSMLARTQDLPFPQTRSGEWRYPKTEEITGGIVGSPVIGENAIYVTNSDGRVYSLDKEFGDLNWKSDILDEKLWTTPVIKGDTIYASTLDGHIYTLSTKTGKKLSWTFESEVGFVSSPALYDDTVFVGSFDRNLCAVKIGDVATLWEFTGGRWFWSAPVVKDGVVYAGCLDGKIYAVAADTGEELWEFDAGSPVVASPVLMGDLLVVAAEAGDVYVFDTSARPQDKAMTPVKAISIDGSIRGSFCAQDGVAYIRTQDNCLYALDIDEGRVSWRLPLSIK